MKNSKPYARKIHKLFRSLKHKNEKIDMPVYPQPVDAIIYAIVSENLTAAATQAAIKRFDGYFIDANDLRVSRTEEIVEVLGQDTPVTRNIAFNLNRVLGAVFDKYNNVSLTPLIKMGKKPARQIIEKLSGTSPFVVDYCMLTALRGHAMPLTDGMLDYLRSNQLVHPDADDKQIRGFLARQIAAQDAFEFCMLLRLESEKKAARRKRKTTKKKKTTQKKKSPEKKKKKITKTKKTKTKKTKKSNK